MNLETLHKYQSDGLLYSQTHPTLPLTIWNYTEKVQYEGLWDEVTLSCRGLVTDDKGNVVTRPFRKFFNIEEGKHTPTEYFEVYEKVDGSLITVFNYNGEWIVSSRGSFTSDQAIAAQRLFNGLKNTEALEATATYLFELIAPWNRIVVNYGDVEELILLGARTSTYEGSWQDLYEVSKVIGCKVVKRYDGISDYSTLKGMVEDNHEGFVVRFSNGDRMKVKGEEYIRLHKVMTNLSTTAVWEVLASGGSMDTLLKDVPDEFYNVVKEYELSLVNKFIEIRDNAISECARIAVRVADGDRKSFAELAKKYQYPGLLFSLLDGKDINQAIWKHIKPEFRKL